MKKKGLAIAWAVLLVYSIYFISDYYIESANNNKVYEELRMQYHTVSAQSNSNEITHDENELDLDTNSANVDEDSSITEAEKVISERFAFLQSEINTDILAWVKIPGTAIDYPVVKGIDNDFYIDHDIYKRPARAGSIFMDFRNEGLGEDIHTILYGHNMRDGSMFKNLVSYNDEDFLLNHNIIEFHTIYEETKWEIFSVYSTETDFYYIETNFPTINDYASFLKSIKDRSFFDIDVDVSIDDQILTLSTCSYETDDSRFVVHAKRLFE